MASLTVKKVSEENLAFFHSLKEGTLNQDQAFEKLIELAKASGNNEEIQQLKEEIERNHILIGAFSEKSEEKTAEIEALKARIIELEENPQTVEAESIVKLDGLQFIVSPSEETFSNMRKCRRYIREDKEIEFSQENPLDYPDKLSQKAIDYYLKRKYSHIIER